MTVVETSKLFTADKLRARPLMPASTTTDSSSRTSSSDDDERARQSLQRCGLVQCRKIHCNLRSHRQFAARHSMSRLSISSSGAERPFFSVRHQPSNSAFTSTVSSIERQITDGFPALPLKDEDSKTFRTLAHHYFTRQIDRLVQIYSPQLNRRIYRSTMMDHALSNETFCMCITASAKIDMLMRGYIRKPDRASEVVYATTAHALRQKLGSFKQTEIDWILVLVVALVGFDLAFNRTCNLPGHHQALTQLIRMKGGIHKVGHVLPYVLNTERHLAVFTGQYPAFRSTPVLPKALPHVQSPSPYGSAFKDTSLAANLDTPVVNFCLSHCQLIHLVETSRISLEPKDPPAVDPSVIPYFLYMRDHLCCEGTRLHADYHENQNPAKESDPDVMSDDCGMESPVISKSRCVLLVVMMIEYALFNGNYYTVKGPFLASELKSILEKHSPEDWSAYSDVLIWLLFVTVSLVEHWEDREWGLEKLRQQLDVKYHKTWPLEDWEDDMAAILKSLVWSNRLKPAFHSTCTALVASK